MRRLLWIGDAACDSGFAKATHYTLETLRKTWDVTVLGLNYRGDPHPYPYPIYPCWPGKDMFGVGRTKELIEKIKPDLVVIQNDPWNIPCYMRVIAELEKPPKVVGTIAVDGKNCRGRLLNTLTRVLFWTTFAQDEAIKGGMTVPSGVVPLGVDLNIYKPGDRLAAREALGLPPALNDAFIVLNVNRNQPRKRLDLTIEYFAEWLRRRPEALAYLFLHVAPTGDAGYDCEQLARYYGLGNPKDPRLILVEPGVFKGATEEQMAVTYQAANVQMSTTQGEGWGLTTLEGMACGIPQIVPDWSALGEWARDAAALIRCSTTSVTPNNINAVGGLPNREETIQALDDMWRSPEIYNVYRDVGLARAALDKYRWENIGQRFAEQLEQV